MHRSFSEILLSPFRANKKANLKLSLGFGEGEAQSKTANISEGKKFRRRIFLVDEKDEKFRQSKKISDPNSNQARNKLKFFSFH